MVPHLAVLGFAFSHVLFGLRFFYLHVIVEILKFATDVYLIICSHCHFVATFRLKVKLLLMVKLAH